MWFSGLSFLDVCIDVFRGELLRVECIAFPACDVRASGFCYFISSKSI